MMVLFILAMAVSTDAAIKTEVIEYKQADAVLEGVLVYDDELAAAVPGIVMVHDWMGISEFTVERAKRVAQLGYVVLAADIYGQGVRPQSTEEASQQATKYKTDVGLMRARVLSAVDVLKNNPKVDSQRLASMGFCFGGTVSLELARSGADVEGVISFHGGLATPSPMDAKDVKAKVLVLHGADDPYVPAQEVQAFQEEMNKGNVDWQMIYYSGAVHSFTRPDAGDDPSKGVAYNANADRRSWEAMKQFLDEIFNQ
jgi:dienelactone hydrolase